MPRPLHAASGSFQKRCCLLPLLAVGVAEEQIRLTTGIRERNQRRQGSCPAEWLALLLDREATHRSTQRFIENLDYRAPRRLDKTLFQRLAAGRWIGENRNLLVTGPCGVGKSWLSCSLAQNACCNGFTVLYARVPRLFADRELAHGTARTRAWRGAADWAAPESFPTRRQDRRGGCRQAL